MNADGLRIGPEDGDPATVRAALGAQPILDVSCYDSFERAQAVRGIADYVAFGSVFVSAVQPGAVRAPLELFARAHEAGMHAVAIGGIDAENAYEVAQARATALAVITAVFGAMGDGRCTMRGCDENREQCAPDRRGVRGGVTVCRCYANHFDRAVNAPSAMTTMLPSRIVSLGSSARTSARSDCMSERNSARIACMSDRISARIDCMSVRIAVLASPRSRWVTNAAVSCASRTACEIALACVSGMPDSRRVSTNFRVSNVTVTMSQAPLRTV